MFPLGDVTNDVEAAHMSDLRLNWTPTVRTFIEEVVQGARREYGVFGTRGDGKTQGVLGAMLAHAARHQAAGYKLPVPWIGVTDTFQSHKLKTVRSVEDPMWASCWQVHDSGHQVVAVVGGRPMVRLDLFGIEDQGAMNRVRMETCGVWFEEPAPTGTEESSSGVSEDAWATALTSQRLPSYSHPAIMTLNYPHEDHWTWQRFLPRKGISGLHPDEPSRRWYRIPPGERASERQREEWRQALKNRPDLLRRLLDGEPGSILVGAQVAEGFREDRHVAQTRLDPVEGEPLLLGVDFGHTPTVIIGQPYRGSRRVLAALSCEHGGIKQHLEDAVLPWLTMRAPWALRQRGMIVGCYDPAGETGEQSDIEKDPVSTLEELLPGLWFPGPVKWESRKHTLVSSLNHHRAAGEPSLQIDPVEGQPLIKALSGRWYYPTDRHGNVRRDLPKKPNHPWEDLGDSFIYWLWAFTGSAQTATIKVDNTWSIFDRQKGVTSYV